jgi:1-deoxy-D-xylulose-5-phosphate synthase
MTIAAPKDENELRHLLKTGAAHRNGPFAVRYPRGNGVGVATTEPMKVLPIGKGETLRRGDDVAIVAIGSMVSGAVEAAKALAAEGIEATVINARFVKPLDEALLLGAIQHCGAVVTVEENSAHGGFGSAVLELLAAHGVTVPAAVLGVPDRFFEQASQARLRELAGLSPAAIADAARSVREAKSAAAGDSGRLHSEADLLAHA